MTARIYQPAKNAMQSGKGKSGIWLLEFVPEQRRSKEPLMGWTSSGDVKQQVKLKFPSKKKAVRYARREGLAFVVEETGSTPKTRHAPKSYSDNFKFGRQSNWTH